VIQGKKLKTARKAIGDNGRAQKSIATIYRRGYRFIADVEENGCHDNHAENTTQNLTKINHAHGTEGLLTGIRCAESLTEALQQRHTLATNESIITKEGIWLSHNWLRLHASEKGRSGVISRQNDIERVTEQQYRGQ